MLTYTLNKIIKTIEIALLLSVTLIALLYCPMRPATEISCAFQSTNGISRRPQRRRDQELSQHSARVSSAMRHQRSLWRELHT